MQHTRLIGLALILSLAGIAGCDPAEPSKPPVTTPAPEPQPTPEPAPALPPTAQPEPAPSMPTPRPASDPSASNRYEGPKVKLDLLQRESFPVQHVAAIEITVPSGGWSLNLDKTEVIDGTAIIHLTLERPGDDEIVTQALVTLREQFMSADPPFTKAKVFVHLAKRDIQTLTTNYRLAAER
jgi:hypothetical protein